MPRHPAHCDMCAAPKVSTVAEDSDVRCDRLMNCMVSKPRKSFTCWSEEMQPLTHTNGYEGLDFTTSLMDLQPYMELIELEPGTFLYAQDGGVVEESQRGVSVLPLCCQALYSSHISQSLSYRSPLIRFVETKQTNKNSCSLSKRDC